jgi:hypothetical protein
MNDLRKSFSLLINVALIGLLIAAWAASWYPSLSTIITITATCMAGLIALAVPIALRLKAMRVTDHSPVAAADDLNHIPNSIMGDYDSSDNRSWKVLLKNWNDPSISRFAQDEVFMNVLRRTLNDQFHQSGTHKAVNIGIVNLVISDEWAKIRLGDASRKVERKNEGMIDVLLRPDLDLQTGH